MNNDINNNILDESSSNNENLKKDINKLKTTMKNIINKKKENKKNDNKEGFSAYFTPKEHQMKDTLPVNLDKVGGIFGMLQSKLSSEEKVDTNDPKFFLKFDNYFKDITIFEKISNLTGDDLGTANGWKTIFEFILYFIPTLIAVIIYEVINLTPISLETSNVHHEHEHDHDNGPNHDHPHDHSKQEWKTFYEKRSHDKMSTINAAYEWVYIWISLYVTYILILRIFSENDDYKLKTIGEYTKTGIQLLDILVQVITTFLTLLPDLFHLLITSIGTCFNYLGISSYPSLNFMIMFIISYFFVYIFLNKIGLMFLQVFDWEADPAIPTFILFAIPFQFIKFFYDMASSSGGDPSASVMSKAPSMYQFGIIIIILLIIWICISLGLSPLAQIIFIWYFIFSLFGSPITMFSFIAGFFGENSVINEAEKYINKNVDLNDPSFMGLLNSLINTYVYPYFSIFMQILFFLNKTIQYFFTIKLTTIKIVLMTFNVYIGLSLLFTFISYLKNNTDLNTSS